MAAQGVITGLYLSGQPVVVKECNIVLTQPKIKDIVMFGEDEFLIATNFIIHLDRTTKIMREGNSQLEMYDDFQLLLVILRQQKEIEKNIQNFLEFVFPNYIVEITPASFEFFVQEEEEKRLVGIINPFNFENFKKIIKDLFEGSKNDSEPEYNPANDAAAAIAEKLRKGRERKAQLNDEGPQSLFGRYASILSIGMQMDINIFFNYTPFQLFDTFTRYFAKVNSDLYTKVSTTPLMDVSKMETPEEWVRNLYK